MAFFKDIAPIKYEGADSRNPLAWKYYNPDEVVLGKKMRDWFRFGVCYWHTWRGMGADMFGEGTRTRSWEQNGDALEIAKRRVHVAFEFMEKLGIEFFTFHDADVAPEGHSLEEFHKNLDVVVQEIKAEMKRTGIKLLWGTANLFSNRRYMNGASTNPDPHVFAYSAAQVKKALEVTHELGGVNYVLWGGREGYASLLNTNMRAELDHMAQFMKLVVEHKKKIGFTGTLLIEPKPREPSTHQYDFDAATVMGFLRTYGLEKEFKLNLEANHATLAGHLPEHEVELASAYGMLGSLDANHGDLLLGWDTDQFPIDVKSAMLIMRTIVRQGGIAPGGLNFDAKLRRESTEPDDLFISHIVGMDTYARALRAYAKMVSEGIWEKKIEERYSAWKTTELGKDIESGKMTLESCANWIKQHPEQPKQISSKEEVYQGLLNSYC